MFKLLGKKGVIVIEVQYLLNTIKDLTFDNIYHEHYNYWSLTSLKNFFENFDATIYKAEKIDTHGGSIRVYAARKGAYKVSTNVKKQLNKDLWLQFKNLSGLPAGQRTIEICSKA